MTQYLDLDDIQGNVLRAYGKFGFPKARYFFLNTRSAFAGRHFLRTVLPKITSARRWDKDENGTPLRPASTMNIGISFMGMLMLDVPTRTLSSMPSEFIDGMRKRAFVLGDRPSDAMDEANESNTENRPTPDWMAQWDPIWKNNRSGFGSEDVHIWISINARVKEATEDPVDALDDNGSPTGRNVLEEMTHFLKEACDAANKAFQETHDSSRNGDIRILPTNGKNGDQEYQEASTLFQNFGSEQNPVLYPVPTEHFGLADGIGDPVFEGQYEDAQLKDKVIGRGKWMTEEKGWEPLATGEFLLGHVDESQALPPAPRPPEFSKNGTFMAYRKLHQNVASYRSYFEEEAKKFASVTGTPADRAEDVLKAKFVGRWPDGVPLSKAPTLADWDKVRAQYKMDDPDPGKAYKAQVDYLKTLHASDFKFATDIGGRDCPGQSHLRRVNTRDYLDPLNDTNPATAPKNNKNSNTSLNKRRRILRRGLPYGGSKPDAGNDDTEQGIAMMVICANLFRQFEFVQQQWVQYGLDFQAGNNTCPLVGDHSKHKRFTIPGDPNRGETTYVCDGLKTFVEPRGGEYFFIPSITALQMLADGVVDPT